MNGNIMNEEAIKILKLQAKLEMSIHDLYEIYAEEFNYCTFWKELVLEEKKHSSWLKGFVRKIKDGSIKYGEFPFSAVDVEHSINNVEQLIEEAKNNEINILSAIENALKLEDELLEKAYLDSLDCTPGPLKNILEKLKEESIEHRQLLIDQKDKYINYR